MIWTSINFYAIVIIFLFDCFFTWVMIDEHRNDLKRYRYSSSPLPHIIFIWLMGIACMLMNIPYIINHLNS